MVLRFCCQLTVESRAARRYEAIGLGSNSKCASERSRRHSVRILPAVLQIGFRACGGATEWGIIHGNSSGTTVGLTIRGDLCSEPQTTIDKEPTQCGRDDGFPVVRIISCPPMADAVEVVGIFQQHFPSMLTM
jgi:hypothetical protein